MENVKTTQQRKQPREGVMNEREISPMDDALNYLQAYAREKPEMAALWCFGIGFVLGWKLKPW